MFFNIYYRRDSSLLQVLYKSVGLHSEMPYKSENIFRQASSEEIDTTRDEGFTISFICEFMWFSFVCNTVRNGK